MKKSIRKLLAEQRKSDKAKALRQLLEMDEGMAVAVDEYPEVPVEDEATAEDELAAGIEAMVLAVLHDDSLDAAGKAGKIQSILMAGEEVTDGDGGDDGGDSGGDDSAMESIKAQVDKMERNALERDLLEDAGFRRSDLTKQQRNLLSKQPDEESLIETIQGFGEPPTRQQINGHRPRMRRRQETVTESYDDVRNDLFPKQKV